MSANAPVRTTRRAMRWAHRLLILSGISFAVACSKKPPPVDNAGGRTPADFPELAADVFKPMDGGITLSPGEIKGRNTWNLWCGGNEEFWDRVAREGLGLFDLLKTIDSRSRDTRFKRLGLINQPGFRKASKPDQHGIWIDEAVEPEPPDIDPKVYGRPTDVLGFRLFDNPSFTGDAVKQWDPKKYDEDPQYATKKDLVRPYRVGVSCGSCHIAFHPCFPPADPENPKWENLASAIGNQYIREGAVFAPNVKEGGFFKEMLKTQPPGTSDTSRIATDHINNPNAINPIFELTARLNAGHEEAMEGETLLLPGEQEKMKVPFVLKDGADSVGVRGATLRVYINIGMFSQHWLQQHDALIGLHEQKPFSIKTAQANSVYWKATEQKVDNIAEFFKRLTSFRLQDAKSAPEKPEKPGSEYITKDTAVMERGGVIFAQNCAECHSSKQPPTGEADPGAWFVKAIADGKFREGNFFSDERRHSVTKIKTNAARAMGTNATKGHIWGNFSSATYKGLSSAGQIEVWNPYTGANEKFTLPAGGLGYYRTPSLISCWSSAPFFHNNALGEYTGDPSIAGRMKAFDDAVGKLLWPDRRLGVKSIWRTTQNCKITIHGDYLPAPIRLALKRFINEEGYFQIGFIPAHTPVNLIANLDPAADLEKFVQLCYKLKKVLVNELKNPTEEQVTALLREEVGPALRELSKCPDLVEDRGHYYGTDLPDADKLALIEFLKTL